VGRHSEFTEEIGTAICVRIADGESLRAICEDDDMPERCTVFAWINRHPEFADQYARAREMSAEADADDVGHYARKAADGEIEPAAARAAIDGLKWSAGKRKPKKYGDAIQMKHSGAIGVFDPGKHTDDQLRTMLSILEPAAVAGRDGGRRSRRN
jgi:hypothetical protein